jgi:hypothetical protein
LYSSVNGVREVKYRNMAWVMNREPLQEKWENNIKVTKKIFRGMLRF